MNSNSDEHIPKVHDSERNKLGVHPEVIKLGFVSLLTDLSSEMIFAVFAVFFTTVAGASAALLGVVEGCADFSASSLNYFAGWLSDRTGKRKIFALAGYTFSTLAKLILIVSSSVVGLSVFRVVERLGKSFRGPPRDAWLAAVADKQTRGYSFGVHKALDKTGAILGPLVAYGLLWWLGEGAATFRTLFWVALIPALLSIVVLNRVNERAGKPHPRENLAHSWAILSPAFKRYLATAGIFSLAYFSYSFLLLRAHTLGFDVKEIVLLYALSNIACVLAAPLTGKLGDHIGRSRIILLSYLIYLLMSLGFAFASSQWQIIVLFVVYGVFYSIDEAQSKAFIADLEHERRASAIGMYNFVTGIIYLPASMIAGALWLFHPAAAFIVAAFITSLAMASFVILRPDRYFHL